MFAVGIVTLRTIGTPGTVNGALALEQGLHPFREGLECQVLVGKQGVSAEGRQLAGMQQGVAGRRLKKTPVAVPIAPEVHAFHFIGFLDHRNHVRMRGVALDEWLQAEGPEARGEAGQLRVIERLIGQGDDQELC